MVGIGQGYLLTTPLQLAVMVARIGNGGIAVEPRIMAEVIRDGRPIARERETFPTMGISPAHFDIVRNGMLKVVNDPKGTAFRARIEEPALAMAGKTGSVQVKRISEREHRTGRDQERGSPVGGARPCALRRLRADRAARATASPSSSSTAAAVGSVAAPDRTRHPA